MYLHCTWGRDRTGTVVLLLQGLLNVSEEDMMLEYRLTGYVTPSVATNNKMDIVFMQLKHYEGDTLQEKIINYLTTTVGVTQEEIASIQAIFLE
jgi:protein tyrosine/serine phosphatase